jgi:DNA-binding PadR family transcriptional regulator
MEHCRTKGFLSFLILWLVSRKEMTGTEISLELKKRRGKKPSPGTIYPVLKSMKEKNLLTTDKNKRYTLTDQGKKSLESHLDSFIKTFYDIDKMKSCCCQSKKLPNNAKMIK